MRISDWSSDVCSSDLLIADQACEKSRCKRIGPDPRKRSLNMNSSTAASQGMLCPVCKVTLSISDRQGVEIDFCPQCRGVCLDRGALDNITAPSTAATPPQSRADTHPPPPPPPPPT